MGHMSVLGANAFGLILASQITARLLHRRQPARLLVGALLGDERASGFEPSLGLAQFQIRRTRVTTRNMRENR